MWSVQRRVPSSRYAEFDVRRLIGHLIGTAKRGLATAERAPSHEAARGFTIETITHGWDFAVANGQPSDVCDDAAQFCLFFVDDVVRARLRLVMYNEPVRIPATASATGHLGAVLGRQEASKTVPG